jgi:hypothetical protein
MRNYDKSHNRAKSLSTTPKKGNSANNTPVSPVAGNTLGQNQLPPSPPQNSNPTIVINEDEEDAPENLLLDPGLMLPFSLPTNTDMLISYGAGLGGMNREREKKYQPSVPPEYLTKLDFSNGATRNGEGDGGGSGVSGWEDE